MKELIDAFDSAAIEAGAVLSVLVADGTVTHPVAIAAVRKYEEALAAMKAGSAIHDARQPRLSASYIAEFGKDREG